MLQVGNAHFLGHIACCGVADKLWCCKQDVVLFVSVTSSVSCIVVSILSSVSCGVEDSPLPAVNRDVVLL